MLHQDVQAKCGTVLFSKKQGGLQGKLSPHHGTFTAPHSQHTQPPPSQSSVCQQTQANALYTLPSLTLLSLSSQVSTSGHPYPVPTPSPQHPHLVRPLYNHSHCQMCREMAAKQTSSDFHPSSSNPKAADPVQALCLLIGPPLSYTSWRKVREKWGGDCSGERQEWKK